MPQQASSQPVTSPVRPNSTTSASAITNGGVMIGRIDISFRMPGVAVAAALHDEREHEAEQRRQHADDRGEHRRVDRDAAARAAAEAPESPDVLGEQALRGDLRARSVPARRTRRRAATCHRVEDENDQQRRDHDDDRRDRGIAAEHAAPRDGARERTQSSAESAIAAPMPNDGPAGPAASPVPSAHATANAAAAAVPRSISL